MNWLLAYIEAVKTRLPSAEREDIGAELHALLEETLENETGKAAAELSEEDTLAWLRTREHPNLVAARYQKRRSLVDEDCFPLFSLTLRYALIGIAVAYTATSFLSALAAGHGLDFADLAAKIFHSGLLAFASLAILFHFCGGVFNAKQRLANWDPKDLPDPEQKWEVEPYSSSIAGLIFTGLFLLFLNGFLSNVASHFGSGVQEAAGLLPAINGVLVASILLHAFLMLKPKWSIFTVAAEALIALVSAYLCYRLLTISPIIEISSEHDTSPEAWERFSYWGDIHLRTLIAIVLAVSLYEIGRDIWRLSKLWRRRAIAAT